MNAPEVAKHRKRAILWDSDGVLVRTEELYFFATRDVLHALDVELERQEYRRLFLKQCVDPLRAATSRRNLSDRDFVALHRERLRLYSRLLEHEDITIDGASETIHHLAESGYLMGVVTGSKREHIRVLRTRTDFFHLFQFFVCLEDVLETKPSPEPYLQGIRRTGFGIAQCVAIEDSERGLRSAKSAGLECWVVPNPMTRDGDLDAADLVVGSLRAVVPLL